MPPKSTNKSKKGISSASKNTQQQLSNKSSKSSAARKATNSQPQSHKDAAATLQQFLPIHRQQLLLNTFRHAFSTLIKTDLTPVLQQVKGHLYDRNFAAAFGKKEYLEAYAVRWSAARALGYAQILKDLKLEAMLRESLRHSKEKNGAEEWKVVAIGGGAGAELVALAGWWDGVREKDVEGATRDDGSNEADEVRIDSDAANKPAPQIETDQQEDIALTGPLTLNDEGFLGGLTSKLEAISTSDSSDEPKTDAALQKSSPRKLKLDAIDMADWSEPLASLYQAITTPKTSASTSTSTTDYNKNSLHVPASSLAMTFHHSDILTSSPALTPLMSSAGIITIMFTLNELFSASLSKTQSFLLQLTLHSTPGTLLLVVDSPGSYSTVKLGGAAERQYPMGWLMDHILLERTKSEDGEEKWEKLVTEESLWFRLPSEGLRYEVKLENMRYQLHLFRRL